MVFEIFKIKKDKEKKEVEIGDPRDTNKQIQNYLNKEVKTQQNTEGVENTRRE